MRCDVGQPCQQPEQRRSKAVKPTHGRRTFNVSGGVCEGYGWLCTGPQRGSAFSTNSIRSCPSAGTKAPRYSSCRSVLGEPDLSFRGSFAPSWPHQPPINSTPFCSGCSAIQRDSRWSND
jgi:hypothetical protein